MQNAQISSGSNKLLDQLHLQWWLAACLALLLISGSFLGLRMLGYAGYGRQWVLQAFLVTAYILYLLWAGLQSNYHPRKKTLLSNLGCGTWITILRGVLVAILSGFVFHGWPRSNGHTDWLSWIPGIIYLVASSLDYVDGLLARMTDHETHLGEILDTKIDALGLFIAPLLAVCYNQLPIYYLSVSAAYYLFTWGIWCRKKLGKTCIELKPRPGARMIAGFQMGFIGVVLLPIFSPPVTTAAAIIFMTPLLAGFIRDWMVMCGTIKTNAFQQAHAEVYLNLILTKWLPLLLRFITAAMAMIIIQNTWGDNQLFTMAAVNDPVDLIPLNFTSWALMVTTAMVVMGILGRIAALVTSFGLAWMLSNHGMGWEQFILFSCATVLMLTGSGIFSIWQPEDKFIINRQKTHMAVKI